MEYICDAPGDRTWFRLVSEGEAAMESELMRHAVEKYFRREWEKAAESFKPLTSVYIEQDIGKGAHIRREMPLFLTLRDDEGAPLVTAMLPSGGRRDRSFGCIIVGPGNAIPTSSTPMRSRRSPNISISRSIGRTAIRIVGNEPTQEVFDDGLYARTVRRPSVMTR